MKRLKRSDCSGKGITRRRHGRGFSYRGPDGKRIGGAETIERIKALAIPPAWTDVWICESANGHIQATGLDDAGRKQYIYHDSWHESAAAEKFDRMIDFASAVPALRRVVKTDLAREGMPLERAQATAVRLIDRTFMRIGSEQYAEQNGTFGVATLLQEHVTLEGGTAIELSFPGKGSVRHERTIEDPALREVAEVLLRRRSGPPDFLVYKASGRWHDLLSTDVNDYIQAHTSNRFSAKDFRTLAASVLAAVGLATAEPCDTARCRESRIREVIEDVSEALGNTPAVCKDSYIDPRVLDRYRSGDCIRIPTASNRSRKSHIVHHRAEKAVCRLVKGA
jgi:DNA topoisomerase IB